MSQEPTNQAPETNQAAQAFDPADIEKNKVMAGLAYILFFLPLVACPESPYGKFHANQGLVLLILGIAVGIIGTIIPFLGWFVILPLGSIFTAVLGIIGIINGLTGKAKELPLIGKIKIIK